MNLERICQYDETVANLRFFAGNEEHIECSGHGGFPYPNILASIGPDQNYDHSDKNLVRIDQGSYVSNFEIVHTTLFNYTPSYEHHNFYVKCISLQTTNENGQVLDVYPLKVLNTL